MAVVQIAELVLEPSQPLDERLDARNAAGDRLQRIAQPLGRDACPVGGLLVAGVVHPTEGGFEIARELGEPRAEHAAGHERVTRRIEGCGGPVAPEPALQRIEDGLQLAGNHAVERPVGPPAPPLQPRDQPAGADLLA